MDDFKEYLSHRSKSLTEAYCWCVRLFLKWLDEFNLQQEELLLSHFQGYIGYLQEEDCKTYKLRLTIAALRNYGYMLVKNNKANERLAMELYIKSIHKHPFPSLFEWEELEQMYKNYSTPGIAGERNKVVLSLFIYQALTVDEIINLCPEHIELTKKTMLIPETYNGKNRVLPIMAHQIPLLDDYIQNIRPRLLAITNKDNDNLFISISDKQEGKNITDCFKTTFRKRYPQFISYSHIRASVLYHWYTMYGLEKTIKMAGHEYVPQSPTKQKHKNYGL